MDPVLLVGLLVIAAIGIYIWYSNTSKPVSEQKPVSNTEQPPSNQEILTPVATKTGDVVVVQTTEQPVVTSALDVNQDGKVDIKDAVEAVKKTRARVKKSLDQDGDGKVTSKDVKVAVSKAKAKAKTKGKAAMSTARGRKAASKKA